LRQFSSVGVPAQESVVVAGRVCSGDDMRLAPTSILLEGDRATSQGQRLKLKLGLLSGYSFFPGQVVAAKGLNNHGTGMVVEEVLPLPVLPRNALALDDVRAVNKSLGLTPLSIMVSNNAAAPPNAAAQVASGPFTPSDSLSFAPLSDLLERVDPLPSAARCSRSLQVQLAKPDVLILLGPFLVPPQAPHAHTPCRTTNTRKSRKKA
jgi:DNA polymerase alpha subunit B